MRRTGAGDTEYLVRYARGEEENEIWELAWDGPLQPLIDDFVARSNSGGR